MSAFKRVDNSGVWLSIKRLKSADSRRPDIVLLPMMHIADRQFFDEMNWERWQADVLLVEGATGKLANYASRAMRFISKGRLGARFQNDSQRSVTSGGQNDVWTRSYPNAPSECTVLYNVWDDDAAPFERSVRWIRADMDEEATRKALSGIPLWAWIVLPFFAIGVAIFGRFFLGRRMTASVISESSKSDRIFEKRSVFDKISRYVMDDRDDYLFEVLSREIIRPDNKNNLIGVQFGAAHMDTLYNRLAGKFGYRANESRAVLALAVPPEDENRASAGCFGVAEEAYVERMMQLASEADREASVANDHSVDEAA